MAKSVTPVELLPSNNDFAQRIAAYGAWRESVQQSLRRYEQWLDDNALADPSLKSRLEAIALRLRDDRMSVAFVAEFSRGKSELINALFFSSYGRRILPSSAGRTTMCPTELMYDPKRDAGIWLLAIESRLRDVALAELRADLSSWHFVPVVPGDAQSVAVAFEAVREVKKVSLDEARSLGLYGDDDEQIGLVPDAQGQIEVPRWRHAVVNIPDPLLEQGLVVIDTPGLNAIGHEPELTLNLIPSADAVLYVLAADAGVTRSDIEVWREHIAPTHRTGRFVVLNKIDGLWDELRSDAQINAEIEQQVLSVASVLDLPAQQIYPVSAQKGLVAKVQQDGMLLERSRLRYLERALGEELVPQKQAIVREHVQRGFGELYSVTHAVLQARRRGFVEQLLELNGLRGKNRNVVELMAGRIKNERTEFERSLRHLQALRTVFSRHSQSIYTAISIDQLKRHVRGAREVMKASNFSLGLRDGMTSLVTSVRGDLDEVTRLVDETATLMVAMYKQFNAEHGLTLGQPMLFATKRYYVELDQVESLYRKQFGAISLVTTEKSALMRRFFESVAARIKELYDLAARELETWLRAVLAPIEGQVREHQLQLRRRLDSVRRVMDASDSLESRITELNDSRNQVDQQLALVIELAEQVKQCLAQPVDGYLAHVLPQQTQTTEPVEQARVDALSQIDALLDAEGSSLNDLINPLEDAAAQGKSAVSQSDVEHELDLALEQAAAQESAGQLGGTVAPNDRAGERQ
jgi:Dynamin family